MNLENVCGIDEAGRGPLAGPVTAAAVILGNDFPVDILNDSKKLSEKKRYEIEKIIKEKAIAWGIANVSHEEIDRINILQASLLAMKNAFENLCSNNKNLDKLTIQKIVVDGLYVPDIELDSKVELVAKVKADATEYSVMAASILAKTSRDKLMIEYSKEFPDYKYDKHKGYPTKEHKEILKQKGPSPIQRRTFSY